MKLIRVEPRLQASDLVLAREDLQEIRCDWSLWVSRNVSNVPNICATHLVNDSPQPVA